MCRELEIEGKDSATVREEKKNGRFIGVAETSIVLAERRRLQQKNLNQLGPPKEKSGLSATK